MMRRRELLDAPNMAGNLETMRSSSIWSLLGRRFGSGSWYLIATVVAAFVLIPIIIYHLQAFTDGAAGITKFFSMPNVGQILLNTLLLAAGATLIATVLAVILAKALLHVPRRLQMVASIIPLLPLVAPPVAIVMGWAFMFSPTVGYANVLLRQLPFLSALAEGPFNIYSMPGITLVTGLDLTGVVFLLVSTRLMEIRGPLEAAAKLAGAGSFKSFMTITLPLLRPSIVAGAVVAFLLGLGQFTAPLFLGSRHGIDVVTTKIFELRESYPVDYATTAALGLPILILGVLAVLAQRAAIGDQRKYTTQSGGGVAEKTSVWAFLIIMVYGLVAVVIPMAAIALVAFSPYWSGDLSTVQFTTDHVTSVLNNNTVIQSIVRTLGASAAAVAVALPVGFIAALALAGPVRAPRGAQYLLDLALQAPLAVPRAVLGLAILFVFIRPPFSLYGTFWIYVIGYVVIAFPFSLRAQQGSLISLSSSLFEAARISGASYIRTVVGITLPLLRRGMAAGAALIFVLLSHDFALSVMVRSPGKEVMGTQLYYFWDGGIYPEVAVMSLLIAVVTGAVLALTLWIGGRSAMRNL